MKTEEQIKNNLLAKVSLYFAGYRSDKLIEHIRMLDWVISDCDIREIEEIIEEKQDV